MPWVPAISRLREEFAQRQQQTQVREEAEAWRQWSRLGVPAGQMLPLGREYERMRLDQPDVRPSTFTQRWLPWRRQREAEAPRATALDATVESLITVGQDLPTSSQQAVNVEEQQRSLLDLQAQAFQGVRPEGFAPPVQTPDPLASLPIPTPQPELGVTSPVPLATPPAPPAPGLEALAGLSPQALQGVGAIRATADSAGIQDPRLLFALDQPFGPAFENVPRPEFADELAFRAQTGFTGENIGELLPILNELAIREREQTGTLSPGLESMGQFTLNRAQQEQQARIAQAPAGDPFSFLGEGVGIGLSEAAGALGAPEGVQTGLRVAGPLATAFGAGTVGLSRLPAALRPAAAAFEVGGSRAATSVVDEVVPPTQALPDAAPVRAADDVPVQTVDEAVPEPAVVPDEGLGAVEDVAARPGPVAREVAAPAPPTRADAPPIVKAVSENPQVPPATATKAHAAFRRLERIVAKHGADSPAGKRAAAERDKIQRMMDGCA